jgi:hypothetical protein
MACRSHERRAPGQLRFSCSGHTVLALALAAPARAQTCPGPRDPIRDYTTIDNRRDPGVELYVFCAHQALIASEVASYRDMHVDAAPAAEVGDPDYARCRGPAIAIEAAAHPELGPPQMFALEQAACMAHRGFVLGPKPLDER